MSVVKNNILFDIDSRSCTIFCNSIQLYNSIDKMVARPLYRLADTGKKYV